MAISAHRLWCVVGCILAVASTTHGTTFSVTHKIVFDSQQKCLATNTGRMPELMLSAPTTGTIACASKTCVETPAGSNSVYVTTLCGNAADTDVTSSVDSFFGSFPTYFFTGTNNFPYLGVEKYAAGKSCINTGVLLNKTLYLADAKCHKTSETFSYRCFIGIGSNSATVTTYTDSTCGTEKTVILDYPTTGVCPIGSESSKYDTKIFLLIETFLYLSSTASYDSKEGDCKSPAVPTQLVTSVVPVDTCSATTSCSVGGDVYAGVSCNSTYSYKADWAATFGSNPYVVVEKYTPGQNCYQPKLVGMTTYLADGRCHQTTTMSSFLVTRVDSTNVATIKTYADSSTCSGTGVTLAIASVMFNLNSCANDVNGVLDTKFYGYGTTAYFLTLKVSYETKVGDCKSPVMPSQIVLATKDIVDACVPVTPCAGTAVPFTSTVCSTPSTYHADATALFGVYPFLTVEKYESGYVCRAPQLLSITTYLADGKCHKTSETTSYRSTRAVDGSATVVTYLCDYNDDFDCHCCTGAGQHLRARRCKRHI
jgi:hypothetical protein